jgi:hypothetical protein
MCQFNLTIIETCDRELPTLTYCAKASANVEDATRLQTIGKLFGEHLHFSSNPSSCHCQSSKPIF